MQAFVLDRAGHYEFLCSLVPGAQHLTIGASSDEHAVNPWDTPDPANPPIEKIAYLVGLHALLVGDHRAGDDSYGLDPLERNLLEVADPRRSTRARRARASLPRESLLREELRRRADEEARRRAPRRSPRRCARWPSGSQSFCGDGSYAYLLDRETTVPPTRRWSPSTRARSRASCRPRCCSCSPSTSRSGIERAARAAAHEPGRGMFAGRSMLVIDEAWKLVERRATGEWVNDLARRSRHLGLFLVAISQQLSDFAGQYGKALLRNSTQQLFLRQSPDELAYVQDAAAPLRRRGRGDRAAEDGQARLLAGLLDQRHPRPRHDRAARRADRVLARDVDPVNDAAAARPRRSTAATATPGRRSSSSRPRAGRTALMAAPAVVSQRGAALRARPRCRSSRRPLRCLLPLTDRAPLALLSSERRSRSAAVPRGSGSRRRSCRSTASPRAAFGLNWLLLAVAAPGGDRLLDAPDDLPRAQLRGLLRRAVSVQRHQPGRRRPGTATRRPTAAAAAARYPHPRGAAPVGLRRLRRRHGRRRAAARNRRGRRRSAPARSRRVRAYNGAGPSPRPYARRDARPRPPLAGRSPTRAASPVDRGSAAASSRGRSEDRSSRRSACAGGASTPASTSPSRPARRSSPPRPAASRPAAGSAATASTPASSTRRRYSTCYAHQSRFGPARLGQRPRPRRARRLRRLHRPLLRPAPALRGPRQRAAGRPGALPPMTSWAAEAWRPGL